MNVKFDVTRFNNEDVIATSYIPPVLCEFTGAHFMADGTQDVGEDGTLYFGGTQYYWDGKKLNPYAGGLVNFPMPDGSEAPVAGQYYYYSDNGWTLCPNQDH